ncbi:C40 family peptidase [Turicimonas muris]|uniref:C40 family peptidase n=1 Tax=Turicimonas muris TaxID=1796652 RepID=UPI00261B8901|nr:NlpC/P60 family protein [Turicimonas muris]
MTCGVNAQTPGNVMSMHNRIHQQQLANVKSKMDKSVISDMLKEDISKRENVVNAISSENKALISDLLSEANRHLGKPYRAGSKGPKAFDCSGFSSYVYRQFGFNLSPSSRAQYTQGEKVDRKSLRKGDLVFFTSRRSGKNVGHVGIVVSADNETGSFKFIHAARTGIKVDNCAGYYEGRYLGARRIIND